MPRLLKVKIPLPSTVLLFIALTMVIAFPEARGSIRGVMFLTLGAYLLFMMVLNGFHVRWVHALWALGFYVLSVASIRWSIYPSGAEDVISNVAYAMLLNWCFGEYIYQGRHDIRHICTVITGVAVLLAVNFFLNSTTEEGRRSLDINENVLGMSAAFSFGVLLYGAKEAKWKKWPVNLLVIVVAFIGLLTGSRKSLLLMLLFVLAFLLFWKPERNMGKFLGRLFIMILVAAVVIFLVLKVDVLYDAIGNRLEKMYLQWFLGEDVDESSISRAKMVAVGLNIFSKKPWIGFGHNAFKLGGGYDTYSHNNYVELLCSLGILGTVLYYLPVIYFTIEAFRLWRKGIPGAILPLSILVIQLINDIGQVSYYNYQLNIFMGLAIGYVYLLKKEYKQGKYDDIVIKSSRRKIRLRLRR